MAAEDYSQDIRLSGQILDRLADAYRRIRNTYRFLLGNLADFDPARDRQPYGGSTRSTASSWTGSPG